LVTRRLGSGGYRSRARRDCRRSDTERGCYPGFGMGMLGSNLVSEFEGRQFTKLELLSRVFVFVATGAWSLDEADLARHLFCVREVNRPQRRDAREPRRRKSGKSQSQ
jgi:hypothetical protein